MFGIIRTAGRFVVALSLMGMIVLLAGCGGASYDGPQRAAVSGKVTLDGAPIPYGTITFKPVGDERMANGVIQNGEYSIEEAMGPNLGKYQVDIRGYEKSPESLGEEEGGEGEQEQEFDLGKQVVPEQYNTATTLELEIDSKNFVHDFELTN